MPTCSRRSSAPGRCLKGASVSPRMLIYAKAGWAWEHGQHTLTPTVPFNVMGGGNDPLASITAVNSSRSRTGWIFGAGVEYAFAPQWSAFIEYNFLDFGTRIEPEMASPCTTLIGVTLPLSNVLVCSVNNLGALPKP